MNIDIVYVVIIIFVILISMTFHEAMHAYTSNWLGDSTARDQGRLTLNPIAHIDPVLTLVVPVALAVLGLPIFGGAKPVAFNPNNVRYGVYGAALVGLAGPLTNFVLAFLFFAAIAIFDPSVGIARDFLIAGTLVNLGFFIFNMLPIPPLDGSRVLYAIAPQALRRLMEVVEQQGLLIVFVTIMLFSSFIGQFILAVRQVILEGFAAIFGIKVV